MFSITISVIKVSYRMSNKMDDEPLMFCSPVYSDRTGRRQSLRNWISFQPTNQFESKSVYVYVTSIDSTKRADSALLQWSTTGRLTFDKNPCQFTTAWPRFLKTLRGNGPKRLEKYSEWKKSIVVTIWQLWDCIKDRKKPIWQCWSKIRLSMAKYLTKSIKFKMYDFLRRELSPLR